jgi:pyruvate/2-oxoglutarate/acetoin dehydrogenase E1 component
LTYKESLTAAMTDFGRDEKARVLGYGVAVGNGANGTLNGVPLERRVEFPVSESLIMSAAVGMSIAGLLPLVYCERMDFMPLMLDAVLSQLDSIGRLSRGQFKPAVIIRTMVGSSTKPPFTAITHCRDLSAGMRAMVTFPVLQLMTAADVEREYFEARQRQKNGESTILVDYRHLM